PMLRTSRGVKKADKAVPPMPAPKTPVAKPRRAGSNQAFTNGIPTANVVPATPRKKPNTRSSAYDFSDPAKATSSTGTADARVRVTNGPLRLTRLGCDHGYRLGPSHGASGWLPEQANHPGSGRRCRGGTSSAAEP